jgi:RNA polymerase sigma factor (TIGR02999 family)
MTSGGVWHAGARRRILAGRTDDPALYPASRRIAPEPDIASRARPGRAFPAEQMRAPTESSAILTALQSGSRESLERLVPLLYQQLRVIAHRQLGRRPRGGTLQTTELVHEAYLKVADRPDATPSDRAHFLALASLAMRHVLVDRVRARARLKRGGERGHVTFDEDRIAIDDQPEALLQLDEALTRLAELEPRLARVVECRFFGGLREDEIAAALGVTVRTVQRDWAKARMLLRRALES